MTKYLKKNKNFSKKRTFFCYIGGKGED